MLVYIQIIHAYIAICRAHMSKVGVRISMYI